MNLLQLGPVAGAITFLVVCLGGERAGAQTGETPSRPNIVIFLADDLGWGELGCQGNAEIPTPHIDSIAAGGVRFTQGYVSGPYCSPTRAGLLTGRYQTRFGHEFNSTANKAGLSLEETTIADRLRALGYATCAIGKWHLGHAMQYRPTRRGFDEFYGTLGNTPFFHPTNFVDSRQSEEVQKVNDPDFYTTDAYAERASDWISRQTEKPFFLYMPFNAQHAPLQAPAKYLDRFPHIVDEKRRMFAAMLSAMDDAIGRVLEAIRKSGQEENTLIFFLTDNGGPTRSTTSSNGILRGFKATTWEGGVRVPFLVQWKGRIPAGKVEHRPVIQLDLLPTAIAAAGGEIDPAWKLDGVNLLPWLTADRPEEIHQTLYWRFGNQWAIRHGDLKLVVANGGSLAPELYDIAADPAESTNLALVKPDQVAELKALWDRWNAEQAPASFPKEVNPPRRNQQRQRQGNTQ